MQSKQIDLVIIIALTLSSLFLYTLPFQKNHLPFGDVDSSTHFTIADSMGQSNKPMLALTEQFYGTYYMNANDGKLWYYPPYHTGAALFQIISGMRVVGIYLFFALMASFLPAALYILIRSLYGQWIGGLSALWILFSQRDMMWYVLGVYLQVAAFALVPLLLFCVHKYVTGRLDKEPKPQYALLGGLILVTQLFIHPQSLLASVLTSGIFLGLIFLTRRKLPVYWKDAAIAIGLIILIALPFSAFIPKSENAGKLGFHPDQICHSDPLSPGLVCPLFSWYGAKETGMGESYYSFSAMHAIFTLPLFIIGLILIFLRRKPEDLLMLSWLIMFFLAMHISIIGLARNLRFMEIEAHIIYPIAVMGLLRLPSLLNLPASMRANARMGLSAALVIGILVLATPPVYNFLTKAYSSPIERLTQPEYDAALWLSQNTQKDESIYLIGNLMLTKQKWIRVLSLRETHTALNQFQLEPKYTNYTYVVVVYSDLLKLSDPQYQQLGATLQNSIETTFQPSQLVHDAGEIKVYRVA